jgi:steroid delta-isomerase-like uncharacterized protein
MSTEANKAVIRRFYEEFNKQNPAGVVELCAPDYVRHGTGVLPDMDLAGMKQVMIAIWAAFPDLHDTLEDLIAEGDKVVARTTISGAHRGDFMGIPPTGKRVSFTGIRIDRIKDGKVVESWGNEDDLGLMQQLGAVPQMAQTGA